jgi:hypothetical protein
LTIHPIPYSWEQKKNINKELYQLAHILSR